MGSAFRKQNIQSEKVYFSGKSRGGARPPYFETKVRPEKTFLDLPSPLISGSG